MAVRKAAAEWRGDLKGGEGDFSLGSGALAAPFTFRSRFEDGQGSNPEELIGAAHAACFSMALSNMLAQAGTPAHSVATTATVHLRFVDGDSTLAKIELDTVGDVPGLSEDDFKASAEQAKEACLISRALAGVPEITLTARLTRPQEA